MSGEIAGHSSPFRRGLPYGATWFWTSPYMPLCFGGHGGADTGAFSLSPIEMAKRIPVGYASFAILLSGAYACS